MCGHTTIVDSKRRDGPFNDTTKFSIPLSHFNPRNRIPLLDYTPIESSTNRNKTGKENDSEEKGQLRRGDGRSGGSLQKEPPFTFLRPNPKYTLITVNRS